MSNYRTRKNSYLQHSSRRICARGILQFAGVGGPIRDGQIAGLLANPIPLQPADGHILLKVLNLGTVHRLKERLPLVSVTYPGGAVLDLNTTFVH